MPIHTLDHMSEAEGPLLRAMFEARKRVFVDLLKGIQTGFNEALLLTQEEWRSLPVRERRYFRLATMTDSIQNGKVVRPYHVFFPHTETGPLCASVAAVARALTIYFKRWLAPARDRLSSRATIVSSKRFDWWGLMRSRSWVYNSGPRIISKFFSAEGGFVADQDAAYVPVMGHVWTPRAILAETDGDALPLGDLLAAYTALFNSTPFTRLLALFAPHVAGGQFDLSARHVNPIPLPDLRALSLDPRAGRRIGELSLLGRNVDVADSRWRSLTTQIVAEMYGATALARA